MPMTSFWSSLMRTLSKTVACGFLGLLILSGCPSTSVYRSADPVAPGRWSFGAATGVASMRDTERDTQFPSGHLELSARRGLAQDLDAGVKLYVAGLEANATWRLHRGRWSWAVAPYLSGLRTKNTAVTVDAIHVFAGSAVVGSRRLSSGWKLSLGPSLGYGLYWPVTGGFAQGGSLGGFINGQWSISDAWALVPEMSAYKVVVGDVPLHGHAMQIGLGVAWTP